MNGTYIKLLPRELRDELDLYLFFDTINIVMGEIYMGKRFHDVLDTMIPFSLILSCSTTKSFKFDFDTNIKSLSLFSENPQVGHYYTIKDKLSDLAIIREYLENAWKINIQIINNERISTITTLTSIESYIVY